MFVARSVRWIVGYMFMACMVACFLLLVKMMVANPRDTFPLLLKLNQLYSFPLGIIIAALFVRTTLPNDVTLPQAVLCIALSALWNGVLVAEVFYASLALSDASIKISAASDLIEKSVAALNWVTALVLGFLYHSAKNPGSQPPIPDP